MAKGAEAKSSVTQKILETFDGAFPYDKEIRIPMMENGELVQIKVTLTCAKTNVESGGDIAVPAATPSQATPAEPAAPVIPEITEEEKNNVNSLIDALGL